MVTKTKYDQLNYIGGEGAVWEPHYNGDTGDGSKAEVYIAKWKVDRSKKDIKLRFSKVSDTSIYTGLWFVSKKNATTKSGFDNNGLECYVVPWTKFERLEIIERDERMLW